MSNKQVRLYTIDDLLYGEKKLLPVLILGTLLKLCLFWKMYVRNCLWGPIKNVLIFKCQYTEIFLLRANLKALPFYEKVGTLTTTINAIVLTGAVLNVISIFVVQPDNDFFSNVSVFIMF